ncbi:hypothetical protein O181_027448 [Austropuccinia psidii MF-1]|uniref:Integrase zinc-binding domain-containing protein n=1 Tax=Austropuccinia psidii MF-1 TaxID=1389203 RepID=A0A9Q3H0Y2_9BASI|nr:hypothetical protein [Austropuccinia psidii MF-1]
MNFQQLIKKDEIEPSRYFAVKVESFSNLIESIQKKLWKDPSTEVSFKNWAKVVVPNDPTIQLRILQKRHDSPLAGHPGQEKTLKLVKWDFHWSGMTQCIKDYVSSCQQCSRNMNIHHKKFRLFKTLPIPNGPWIGLSMDFITQLQLSNSFDSILVIVDRFSKMAVFIPTISLITSLDLAHFLKAWPSFKHYDWNTWLPLAEFAYNNSDHSSTKQSPVFTVYGRDPQFDSAHITQDNPAGKLSTKIQSVQQDVKRELEASINRFKRASNELDPPKKLSERLLGPFPILKKISTHDYHLKLPSQWKSIHPVFHISLLEPVKTSTIPNWHQDPPPPVIIEKEEEWEVSQILD